MLPLKKIPSVTESMPRAPMKKVPAKPKKPRLPQGKLRGKLF